MQVQGIVRAGVALAVLCLAGCGGSEPMTVTTEKTTTTTTAPAADPTMPPPGSATTTTTTHSVQQVPQ
jgi:hypothetical protein